jgi:transaldolase
MLRFGEIGRLVEEVGTTGLTSNLTTFEKALAQGEDYQQEMATSLDLRLTLEQTYERLAVQDIREAAGAAPQRLLWASTGAEDSSYRDLRDVEELVGPYTVNTMPRETIRALIDHGEVRGNTLLDEREHSRSVLAQLLSAGIYLEKIGAELEQAGMGLFSDSYRHLARGLAAHLRSRAGIPVAIHG